MRWLLPVLLVPVGCAQAHTDAGDVGAVDAGAPSSVHRIDLPHDEPTLPPGRGRDAFIAGCVTCHSPRYVTNQPLFTRTVWTEEVNKMVKTFGAPIPADKIPETVDYLVLFHGKEDAK